VGNGAKDALADPKVRASLRKMQRDAKESGSKVSLIGPGGEEVDMASEGAVESAAGILEPVAREALSRSTQVDLEGKRAVLPVHRSEPKLTKTYKYENEKARLSFTEKAIEKECLDPPEGKDAVSILVFVQNRIKFKGNLPLGDEMQSLVVQFEKAVRSDFVAEGVE